MVAAQLHLEGRREIKRCHVRSIDINLLYIHVLSSSSLILQCRGGHKMIVYLLKNTATRGKTLDEADFSMIAY